MLTLYVTEVNDIAFIVFFLCQSPLNCLLSLSADETDPKVLLHRETLDSNRLNRNNSQSNIDPKETDHPMTSRSEDITQADSRENDGRSTSATFQQNLNSISINSRLPSSSTGSDHVTRQTLPNTVSPRSWPTVRTNVTNAFQSLPLQNVITHLPSATNQSANSSDTLPTNRPHLQLVSQPPRTPSPPNIYNSFNLPEQYASNYFSDDGADNSSDGRDPFLKVHGAGLAVSASALKTIERLVTCYFNLYSLVELLRSP